MANLAELEAAFGSFLEKAGQLQTDVQEVQAAQEALSVAEQTLAKEQQDVDNATASICDAAATLTASIQEYVSVTLGVNCDNHNLPPIG